MSLERMLDTLIGLGLTRKEAQAYIFLAKRGPHTVKELAKILRANRKQLCCSLKNLQAKGIVKATRERTVQFSAISLEKMLDLFTKAKTKQAKTFQASRKGLLADWHSIIEEDSSGSALYLQRKRL